MGIYKYTRNKHEEELCKVYLTNFRVMEATRIKFVDKKIEGIKLILKSANGEIIERLGEVDIFDDVKSFKNYLGAMELTFKGNLQDLTNLKIWINNYFTFSTEEIHTGVQFITKNNIRMLVTNYGAISEHGLDSAIRSVDGIDINIADLELITAEEAKEALKYLFNFAEREKSLCIIGTIVNDLCIEQCMKIKIKGNHLKITGESGSGKSTIIENVIKALLNYPAKDTGSAGMTTNFALIKAISTGNSPIILDEYKPSQLNIYQNQHLSEILRNAYDRTTVYRGDKNLKNRSFVLNSPIIISGEESYRNNEKALIERSCIIYLSKKERTQNNEMSMEWIKNNTKILNKLGKSIINTILKLDTASYKNIRENLRDKFPCLKDRILNTAINIVTGIEVLNILLRELGVEEVTDFIEPIDKNLKTDVLGDKEESLSEVEQMLILYNEIIEDNRAENVSEVIKNIDGEIYIKTSEMVNQLQEFNRKVGSDIILLQLSDFKKQAKKANYIIKSKYLHFNDSTGTRKTVRFDEYNKKMLQKLDINSIAPRDIVEIKDVDNDIPF